MNEKTKENLHIAGWIALATVGILIVAVVFAFIPSLANKAWAYEHQDEIKQAQKDYEKEQAAAEIAAVPDGYIKVHSSGVQLINTDSIVKVTPCTVNGIVRAQITVEEQRARWSYSYGRSRNVSYVTEESYTDVINAINEATGGTK